jgi:hypothetical protein
MNVISVSVTKNKGYEVLFQDGQMLIMPRGSNSYKVVIFGVRERNLYRINGQLM